MCWPGWGRWLPVPGGDAPSFGCVGGAGAWCFPLGGGLGLVVAISLGSVKGGVGVEFGCGQ